nr:hypothetical protein [uncultured Halomonas sp.]
MLKLTFSLRMDSYHQLMASFMADILPLRKSLGLSASLVDAFVNHGAVAQLTPLLEQGKLITPTQRLYAYWRSAFFGILRR